MVKIINQFGDVKKGKQHTVVYQEIYGNQMRRTLKDKKDEHTRGQLEQRERFKVGINFAKGLTKAQRDFIKSYMAEAGIRSPDGLPTTWYSFTKKIAMTRPKVEIEIEAGSQFDAPYGSWTYRKPITLNNTSGGTLSNYQVLITLTTSNFTYAKCKADGSDIRFSQDDKTTPLSYWIEDWNYNGNSKIWVKVDSIPTGENLCLYLYYGNSNATSESNGDNTFEFFDNFPGTAIDTDKWAGATSSATVADGIMTFNANGWPLLHSIDSRGSSIVIRARLNYSAANNIVYGVKSLTDNSWIRITGTSGQGKISTIKDSTPTELVSNVTFGSYAIYDIIWESASAGFFKDGIEMTNSPITTNIPDENNLANAFSADNNGQVSADWVLIRKHATNEPTSEGGFGEEDAREGPTKLKAFTIHHPAIKSYELADTGMKEEGISNLKDHISSVITKTDLNLSETKIIVKTLANQEYEFIVK